MFTRGSFILRNVLQKTVSTPTVKKPPSKRSIETPLIAHAIAAIVNGDNASKNRLIDLSRESIIGLKLQANDAVTEGSDVTRAGKKIAAGCSAHIIIG